MKQTRGVMPCFETESRAQGPLLLHRVPREELPSCLRPGDFSERCQPYMQCGSEGLGASCSRDFTFGMEGGGQPELEIDVKLPWRGPVPATRTSNKRSDKVSGHQEAEAAEKGTFASLPKAEASLCKVACWVARM